MDHQNVAWERRDPHLPARALRIHPRAKSVSPIQSRMLRSFYGTADLGNIFQTGGDDKGESESSASCEKTLENLTTIQIQPTMA